jgi:uncharacterized SAM-binding protein YcdF (DUF218 family)
VARAGKLLAVAAGVVLFAFLAGFAIFAGAVMRYAPSADQRADGIVVLTGGEHRLSQASQLLSERRGKRLLISGANPIATRHDLHRKSGLSTPLFECCVDIGYTALDTIGNADETKAWARAHSFTRLIIVTSSYHMPRSLVELGRAMPDVTLVPYPVVSQTLHTQPWWAHAATARLLFTEYMKFLPSAARFGVARLLRSWDGSAVAGGTEFRAVSI